jgi:hypothetical protein
MPAKIKTKIDERNAAITATPQRVVEQKAAAAKSGATAADQNAKRNTAFGDQGKQAAVLDGQNRSREGAQRDVATHNKSISDATDRKTANEKNLTDIQTKHQADVDKMKKNADGTVAEKDKDLKDATAAAAGPRKDEVAAAAAIRSKKENESEPNAQAIKDKGTEISTARDNETRGKGDYDDKTRAVGDAQRTLDTQGAATGPIKKDRDDTLATANANVPVRSGSDDVNASRRGRIADTEVPAQQAIKDKAARAKDDAAAGLTTTTKAKDVNTAELDPMPAARQARVNAEADLKKRTTDAEKARETAQKSRDAVATDISAKRETLQGKRQHSDDIDNTLKTRELQESGGVRPPPTKDVELLVSSKQREATTAGTAASKDHAAAVKGLDGVNQNTTDMTKKLKTNADEQGRLGELRDEAKAVIPRETANAASLDAARNAQPAKLRDARRIADEASGKAAKDRENIEGAGQELDMAKDAHSYFNDPLEPQQKIIRKSVDKANEAGASAAKHREDLDAAGLTQTKKRQEEADADAGRKQSANDAVAQAKAREDAIKRKADEDTRLADIQKKHQNDMETMRADVNGTVGKHKKNLDDANADVVNQGAKAEDAKRLRSAKETEADAQGKQTAAKLDEVNAAKKNEADAAAAAADAKADAVKRQNELDPLVSSEPALLADRTKTRDIAEASRPTRDPKEVPAVTRRDGIESSELPVARKKYDDATAERDRVAGVLGDAKNRRKDNEDDLNTIRAGRDDLTFADSNRRAKRDMETKKRDENISSREKVDETIADGNLSIQKRSQHGDRVDTLISTKKPGDQKEPVADVQHNIDVDRTIASNGMASSSRQHGVSEGSLTRSKAHTKDVTDSMADSTATADNLSKARKDVNDSITAEKGTRTKHLADMDGAVQKREGLKKQADDAASNANDATVNKDDLVARPGGIDDVKYYRDQAQADVDAANPALASKKAAAEAGETAAAANTARNKSSADAEKAKGDRQAQDANRAAEDANVSKHKATVDDARARKMREDTNLENIKKKHQDDIDKMNSDAGGAAASHKKKLDDADSAATAQGDAAKGATKKRGDAEKDMADTADAVGPKKKEVDDARDNELAAKNKMDDDAAARKKQQDDLDALTTQEPALKKSRDDAAADVENARPQRSAEDTAKKDRQGELDRGTADAKNQKDDAERAKAVAVDGAARTKAKKDALPEADDTTPLRERDSTLKKKKDDEEDSKESLEKESANHKTKVQEGEFRVQTKQSVAGMISSMILDLVNKSFLDKLLAPPPPPPTIQGYFSYPIGPSGSVSSTTETGARPAGFVDNGTGIPEAIPTPIEVKGMGDLGDTGPFGASGSNADSFSRGRVAGGKDGTRDATSDATDAYSNKQNQTIRDLESKIEQLDTATKVAIDKQVAVESQNAYCKQVGEQGTAQKLDIYKTFSECSAYFQKHNPRASQPLEKKKEDVEDEEDEEDEEDDEEDDEEEGEEGENNAEENENENENNAEEGENNAEENENENNAEENGPLGPQEGGYTEDLSGVMQFSGPITDRGPVVPSEEDDMRYMEGYRVGYKEAYTRTYSLTMAIKITENASKKVSERKAADLDYGDEVETIINASMPRTEGTAKDLSRASRPVTEASAKVLTDATGPVTEAAAKSSTTTGAQEGGYLKKAQRKLQRGRTLTQHERLLKRIAKKTTAA